MEAWSNSTCTNTDDSVDTNTAHNDKIYLHRSTTSTLKHFLTIIVSVVLLQNKRYISCATPMVNTIIIRHLSDHFYFNSNYRETTFCHIFIDWDIKGNMSVKYTELYWFSSTSYLEVETSTWEITIHQIFMRDSDIHKQMSRLKINLNFIMPVRHYTGMLV